VRGALAPALPGLPLVPGGAYAADADLERHDL
jgi:hypothetical protein